MLSNDLPPQVPLDAQVQQLRQQLQQAKAIPDAALEATLQFLAHLASQLQPSYVILEAQDRWLPLTLSNRSVYLVGFAHTAAAEVVASRLEVSCRRLDSLPLLWRSLGQAAHLAFFDQPEAGTSILRQQPIQPIAIRREQIQAGLREALKQSRLA